MDRADSIRRLKEASKLPKERKVYQIPKVSKKKAMENSGASDETIWPWFLERRKEMTGKCQHCGGKTERYNDKMFHFSVAHILPKKLFDSVKTHPLNFIEFCYYGNSCHSNFDNFMLDITDLNCFDLVIERFVAMYP